MRNAIVQDNVYEGAQTYTLSATNTGGTAGTGTGTIVDDGTGTYFPDASPSGSTPATDSTHVLDDDRTVTVNSITVNEGSPSAVFTVTGAANQKVTLSLADGTAHGAALSASTPTDGSVDYGTSLQYWNGTVWTAYTAGSQVSLSASGKLLVRNAIVQDSVYEGAQTYTLIATNTGGTAGTGTGTIVDDGTGTYFPDASPSDSTPATDSTHVLDDDRAVTVNNVTVNEGSPYAVFTVTGAANQKVTLSLSNGTATGGTTTPTDGSVDFNTNLQYWNGTAWTAYSAGAQVSLNASGTLLVRNAIVQDNVYEGAQTYTLIATNTGGTAGTGTGTIVDDGTGTYFPDASPSGSTPATDSTHVLDDDRAVTVNSVTVNEGSPYAVFTVTGAANQKVTLSLSNGTATGGTTTPTDGSVDFNTNLQYWNGTAWTAYTAGAQVSLDAGGKLLVRNAVVQDNVYEGAQTYTLSATNTGGTAGTGTGTIVDDGTGTYFPDASPSGSTPATDSTHVLDDDRAVTVNSVTVNEGSPYAVFTVTGAANQKVTLALNSGTAIGGTTTPTDGTVDFNTNLQYWNGTAWTAYTAGTLVSLDANGKLLVRNAIVQDSVYEGAQTYSLVVANTGGTAGTGTATIMDDGTGTYFPDASPSGSTPAIDSMHVLDDDRQKPAVLVTPPPPPAEVTPAPVVPTPPPPRSAPLGFASELQPVPLRATLADPPQAIGDVKTSNSGYQIPVNDSAPPGLTLYRGITDQVVQTTEAATKVSMPFDAFIHTNKDAVIKLEAKQADNSPLPKWVQFDPATGVFEVTPPKGFKGKLDLMIKARDDDGREATAMFQMFVGEQGQTLRPQSRSSFSEKLRLASKHPVTLVRVADGRLHGVAAPDARVMKVRAG